MAKLQIRARFVNCLLIFNLAASALGAAGVGLIPGRSAPWRAFRAYGVLSGASDRYSLFAPNIRTQGRVRFQIETGAGLDSVVDFEVDGSRDTKLRLSVMTLGLFPSFFDRQAPAWAADVFRRHSEAVRVVVFAEDYIVPTMEQYRAGVRPGWTRRSHERVFTRDRPAGPIPGTSSNTVRVGPGGLPTT